MKTGQFFKTLILAAVVLTAVYYVVLSATSKSQLPTDVTKRLDSLQTLSHQLINSQNKYDSLLSEHKKVVTEIDNRIAAIKGKTTVIREYYHDKSQEASQYTPTEVDSFFKQRYGY